MGKRNAGLVAVQHPMEISMPERRSNRWWPTALRHHAHRAMRMQDGGADAVDPTCAERRGWAS
eukprot:9253809-Pyramimonas_sp.AAC.1